MISKNFFGGKNHLKPFFKIRKRRNINDEEKNRELVKERIELYSLQQKNNWEVVGGRDVGDCKIFTYRDL